MSTSAPVSNEPRNSDSRPSARNIFEDPAISEAAKNDAFVRFVSKHWRSSGLTLLAIVAAIVAYQIFMSTALQKRAQATGSLTDIQEAYQALTNQLDEKATLERDLTAATDEKVKVELSQKIEAEKKDLDTLREKINLMISSLDSSQPFQRLAALYRGLVAAKFGDFDTARASLGEVSWQQVGSPNSSERAVAEVVAFGLSKSLLQTEKYRSEAQASLEQIARQGTLVPVEAVRLLAASAATPEEKKLAHDVGEDVKKRYPSVTQYLSGVGEGVATP